MSQNEENKLEMNNLYELKSSTAFGNLYNDNPKPKKEGKFTLSTIIYKKFGKGENKKKRYEKITNEIKKIEQNSKKELVKLSNQITNMEKKLNEEKEKEKEQIENNEEFKIKFQEKMLNLRSKKLTLMELERDKKYNYLEVIQRLKIPPEKRTIRDVLRIKNYLIQSKLGLNITEEFTDKNIVEKIINFCCIEMRYHCFKKGEVIVKIGEKLDSFYSIISGKIETMKPFEKKVEMTGFEYFKYLMDLKRNKENYILNQCIKNNEQNFVVEANHLDIIHYIYLLNYLEYIHLNKKPAKELDDIITLINLNPSELGIDPYILNSDNYKHDYLKVIKKKLPDISHILFDQYSFFNDYKEKKEVIIYEYKKVNTLKSNDYFGDSLLETREPLKETIVAEENCDMAVLSNKLYSEQILSEKSVLLDQKISDLHENHFFREIKYGKFSKKYFKLFINEKYKKEDIIFNEGDEVKYVYFIQEGTVELSLTKSINEIEFLIDCLLDKKDIISEDSKSDLRLKDLMKGNYTFEEFLSQQNFNKNSNYIQLPNSNEEIDVNYLNEKQNNKLIILKNNEDFGIISLILGNKYIATSTVTSKTANIYKLDKNHLKMILSHESECEEELFERLKSKIDLIEERLSIISNIKLVIKGKKEKQENNILVEKQNQKSKKLKKSNIKAFVDYEKISNLLENKAELNSSYDKLNSAPQQTKIKNDNNINLPLLKSFNRMNTKMIQTQTSKDKNIDNEENSKEFSKSKILYLMKKGLMFNLNEVRKNKNKVINQKKKIESAKKWKIEDKFISKIQKDIKEFSSNQFSISQGKSSKSKNENNIMSYSTKNSDNIYLTKLNILKNIKPFSETEREREKENNITSKNNFFNKKENPPLPVKLHSLEKIFSYTDKNKKNENNVKNNYIRFNTEENLLNENKMKRINHSYKNPLTLIKQEKYKIFDRNDESDKYNIDYLSQSIEKMRELKKIYSNMKQNSNPKYRYNNFQ